MANSAEEVRVAVDGVVSSAPLGTTLPTTVDGALGGTFTDVGYISEDGVTEANSRTTEQKRAWQKRAVVRTLVTEGETTFQFTMIQTTSKTLSEYYGIPLADINAATGSFVTSNVDEAPRQVYVLDVLDGDDKIRKVIADGQVTERGDIVYVSTDIIQYEVTITAYDNEALGGSVKHFYSALVTP